MIREKVKKGIDERYARKVEILKKHPEYYFARREREAVKFHIACTGLCLNSDEEKYMKDLREQLEHVRFF